MKLLSHCLYPVVLSLMVSTAAYGQTETPTPVLIGPAKWEKEIRKFEEADAQSPPPKDAILFVGSSSIRLWKTNESFPDHATINRGFGGSQLGDSLHFADRIILKYSPRVVVIYAGENDLAAKTPKTPDEIVAAFEQMVKKIHEALPNTRIIYLSIKPSPKRFHLAQNIRIVNRRIEHLAADDDQLIFLDVHTPMLDIDGRPRAELFVADNIHMNPTGYALWNQLLDPYLGPKPIAAAAPSAAKP